jgi:hypothetical protein
VSLRFRLLLIFLIILYFVACKAKDDNFNVSDISGDNSQVSITLSYAEVNNYLKINQDFALEPSLVTVGIYDSSFYYTIFPDLPSTISLNPNTGEITGRPTYTQSLTRYVITATKDGYSGSFNIYFAFVDEISTPTYISSTIYFDGFNNTEYLPQTENNDYIWSISGTLPPGISFNTTTGALSGTCTDLTLTNTAFPVTITSADNSGDFKTTTLTIRVSDYFVSSLVSGNNLGFTSGSPIDLSAYLSGGRGNLVYEVVSGGGSVDQNGLYSPPSNPGQKTVSVTDLWGTGNTIDLVFNTQYPQISLSGSDTYPTLTEEAVSLTFSMNGASPLTASMSFETTVPSLDSNCIIPSLEATSSNYSPTSGTFYFASGQSSTGFSDIFVKYDPTLTETKYFCVKVYNFQYGTSSVDPIYAVISVSPPP